MHAPHILHVRPARRLTGSVRVPGDKSISHRYLMLAALSLGRTSITNLSTGADVLATQRCLQALGTVVRAAGSDAVRIESRGWLSFRSPSLALDAANSGTTMRLLAGLVAGRPMDVTIAGDASLSRRPMTRIIDPLTAMGARIASRDGRAPLAVAGGGLRAVTWTPEVPSAQVKSAVMLAALSADGTTTVVETVATRDHTERAFPLFGLAASVAGRHVQVPGGQEGRAPNAPLAVPGDPSSAAVWAAAAAAVPGSSVTITGVSLNPRRLGFVRALRALGATVEVTVDETLGNEPVGTMTIRHNGDGECVLAGDQIPDLIDELPVLAARAALGGRLDVRDAAELRVKESDRISALVGGLRALGVSADERPDGFVVDGSRRPSGGAADAAGDHRLVMAFALVGLGASGPVAVHGADAVTVSYPDFAATLDRLTS